MANASVLSNPHDFVSVTGTDLQDAGFIVTWRLTGSFDPEPLRNAWLAAGLPDRLLPALPSEQRALGMAMKELAEHRTLIRPLDKRAGWKVVPETAKDDDLTYKTDGLTAKLDVVGRPVFKPVDHRSAARVRALYEEYLLKIPCSSASHWMSSVIMPYVDAVSVKDNGGVYFVPPHRVSAFERMVQVIQEHTKHRVYAVPVVRAEATVSMVLDAMTDEVSSECSNLLHDLATVGERALQTRTEGLNALLDKVARFEKLLGTKLTAAREAMADADGAIAAAMLAATADMKS